MDEDNALAKELYRNLAVYLLKQESLIVKLPKKRVFLIIHKWLDCCSS